MEEPKLFKPTGDSYALPAKSKIPVDADTKDKLIDAVSSEKDSRDEPNTRTRRHAGLLEVSKTSISTFSTGDTTKDDGLTPVTGSSNLTNHSKIGDEVISGDEPNRDIETKTGEVRSIK